MRIITALISFALTLSTFAKAEKADHVTWTNSDEEKMVFINGLKEDLFQKYRIVNSKGPKWGKYADDIGDAIDDGDLQNRSSSWADTGLPTGACPNFTDEDFEGESPDAIDYGFTWEAIKLTKGSDDTVYYLARFYIVLQSPTKQCQFHDRPDEVYVLLGKPVDGKPVYLGKLSEYPPEGQR